jgi:pimeloyl-ACP methyl ester carboxylesterase
MMDWREYQESQKILEINEGFISYTEYGNRKNPSIICIHGIPTWGYIFHDLALNLSQSYHVLVPDLMGFGFSSKADNFDRAIDKQANYLIQWMDKLKLDTATLIAHDIGGGVAQRLVIEHENRFNKLCLMNSVTYDSWPIEMMIQIGHPLIKKLSSKFIVGILRQALKQGFYENPDKKMMAGILAPWTTDVGLLSLIRNASALNTNLTTELTDKLPNIKIRTLLLWGSEDKFQNIKYAYRLSTDIAEVELVEVLEARHWVMLDQPQKILSELENFLRTTKRDTRIKRDENIHYLR